MYVFGFFSSKIGSLGFEMVPVTKEMGRETWRKIALDMLEMMYNGEGQAGDRDFKKLKHKRGHIFSVRKDLIKNGVIRRIARGKYELVVCKLRPRSEILAYLDFIRSGDADRVRIGARALRKACSTLPILTKIREFEEFLQVSGLKALVEEKARDVAHVIQVEEVWRLFLDVLDGSVELPNVLKHDVMDALFEALRHVKDHEHEAVLKMPFGGDTLEERLRRGARTVALETSSHSILEKCFKVLWELGVGEDYILNTIRELLETKGDRLGHLSGPIHTQLMGLGDVKVRSLLLEWARSECDELKHGALLFLESMV